MTIPPIVKNHTTTIIGVAIIVSILVWFKSRKQSAVLAPLSDPNVTQAYNTSPITSGSAFTDSSANDAANQAYQQQVQAQQMAFQMQSAQMQQQLQAQLAMAKQQEDAQLAQIQAQTAAQNSLLQQQTASAIKLQNAKNNPFAGCQGLGCVGSGIGAVLNNLPLIGGLF